MGKFDLGENLFLGKILTGLVKSWEGDRSEIKKDKKMDGGDF